MHATVESGQREGSGKGARVRAGLRVPRQCVVVALDSGLGGALAGVQPSLAF